MFDTPAPKLLELAAQIHSIYRFDSSHGMDHLLHTRYNAIAIMNADGVPRLPGMDPCRVRNLIKDSAFIHDLIDAKYVRADEKPIVWATICRVLVDLGWTYEECGHIYDIIDNMSFSKCQQRRASGLLPVDPALPSCHCIHVVRDADMLDAYDPTRCLQYQLAHHPDCVDDHLRSILVDRVLKYKDHHLTTPYALSIAPALHKKVEQFVQAFIIHE